MIGAGRRVGAATAALCVLCAGTLYSQATPWHSMPVPEPAAAVLQRLGVADGRPRGSVMVDLVRRIQLEARRDERLRQAVASLAADSGRATPGDVRLPLPLSPHVWSEVLLDRAVPLDGLFTAIVTNEAARLLYHGLAGLDASTLQWFEAQPALLRDVKRNRDALRAFAWFAPAVRVIDGRVVVPAGPGAEERWSSVLGAAPWRPDEFVRRLFAHQGGRTAGLYFLMAGVEPPRRAFLLGAHLPAAQQDEGFRRLVAQFSRCYPEQSTDYPFVLRSFDAALLLMEVQVGRDGAPAGRADRRFWHAVFGEAQRSGAAGSGPVDAAWMIDVLCGALAEERPATFATILAGTRLFGDAAPAGEGAAIAALQSRRAYPALFLALEQAAVTRPEVYAAAARHAALLGTISDAAAALTALRQFQGAVALALNATLAGTLSPDEAGTLVTSLAALPLVRGRYDGRVAEWLVKEWMPAVRPQRTASGSLPFEQMAAAALAGPDRPAPERVHWEGLDYLVDLAGSRRQRLLEVRARQGGATLDAAIALHGLTQRMRVKGGASIRAELDALARDLRGFAAADEYGSDVVDVSGALAKADGASLLGAVDFLLAHALPAWAYAPHVGAADGGALVGGDGSLRHRLGVRAEGRSRVHQRWAVAVSPAARGVMNGSIAGVQAGLASWSLRRLASDAVPAAPAVDGNDVIPLTLTAALSDPRQLTNRDRDALAAALDNGARLIRAAGTDFVRLDALADRGAISAWRRAVLPWMAGAEPDRIAEQFAALPRARIGGAPLAGLDAWGSVAPATGPLRLRLPPPRLYELAMGRDADGIVSGHSVDLMLRLVTVLAELKLPAALAAPLLAYAMRDHLDRVRPVHAGDIDAFARQAARLSRREVEDYVGALAAVGPLRPAP